MTLLAFLEMLAAPTGAIASGLLTAQSVNDAQFDGSRRKADTAIVIKAEVLLARAHFSPGVIDGKKDENFRKALAAFQRENGFDATGEPDEQSWNKLVASSADPAIADYVITFADVRGPFLANLPDEMEKMVGLARLSYTSAREEIAEKFHMSQELLQTLNPGSSFDQAGTRIAVANVRPELLQQPETTGSSSARAKPVPRRETHPRRVIKIEVDKQARSVRALNKLGELIAFYPASIGSEEKPTPSGTLRVKRIAYNPTYHYDPKFAFKEVTSKREFAISAGPNNPLGLVWIQLSKRSYGIHGTADPENVSKTSSHGCVRLTNWDARALAKMVSRRTIVDFKE